MKKDEKRLITSVVGNIITQYLSTLKEHRELSQEQFKAKSSYGYACNINKCSKGITYAERIMDNLPEVLFRNKIWTRKELNSVFHDKEYNPETVASEWGETLDSNLISQNVIVVLESIGGMRATDVFAALIGYTLMRAETEIVDCEKWVKGVEVGDFGKIGVNYGKTKDFDVLFGTDKTELNIDFRTPYMIIRKNLVSKIKGFAGKRNIRNVKVKDAMRDFTFGVYPRNYGSLIRACDPCAPYQRKFVEFRQDCFDNERILKLQEELCGETDEFDMIV